MPVSLDEKTIRLLVKGAMEFVPMYKDEEKVKTLVGRCYVQNSQRSKLQSIYFSGRSPAKNQAPAKKIQTNKKTR